VTWENLAEELAQPSPSRQIGGAWLG